MKGFIVNVFKFRTIIKHALLIPLFFFLGYKISNWLSVHDAVGAWSDLSQCEQDVLNYKKLWVNTIVGLCFPMFAYYGFRLHCKIINEKTNFNRVLDKLSLKLFNNENFFCKAINIIIKIAYYLISNPINFITITGALLGGMFLYHGMNNTNQFYIGLVFPIVILLLAFSLEFSLKEKIPEKSIRVLTHTRNFSLVLAFICWAFSTFYYKWEPFIKAGWKFIGSLSS